MVKKSNTLIETDIDVKYKLVVQRSELMLCSLLHGEGM